MNGKTGHGRWDASRRRASAHSAISEGSRCKRDPALEALQDALQGELAGGSADEAPLAELRRWAEGACGGRGERGVIPSTG